MSSVIITTLLSILALFEEGFNNIPVTVNVASRIILRCSQILYVFIYVFVIFYYRDNRRR